MKHSKLETTGLSEMTISEQMSTNGGDGEIGVIALLVLLGLIVWGLITGKGEIVPFTDTDPMLLPDYM